MQIHESNIVCSQGCVAEWPPPPYLPFNKYFGQHPPRLRKRKIMNIYRTREAQA